MISFNLTRAPEAGGNGEVAKPHEQEGMKWDKASGLPDLHGMIDSCFWFSF